jgi:hypothetical protein
VCGVKKKKKKKKKGGGEGRWGLRVWWGKSEKKKKKKHGVGKKKSFICLLGPKCRIVKIC